MAALCSLLSPLVAKAKAKAPPPSLHRAAAIRLATPLLCLSSPPSQAQSLLNASLLELLEPLSENTPQLLSTLEATLRPGGTKAAPKRIATSVPRRAIQEVLHARCGGIVGVAVLARPWRASTGSLDCMKALGRPPHS